MSTRSATLFVRNGEKFAAVYRHSDGMPEVAGVDIRRFLRDVAAHTDDTRYTDPTYLAAKYVVWLANKSARRYHPADAKNALDFLSVGVIDPHHLPGDIDYLYTLDCSCGFPGIECRNLVEHKLEVVPQIPQGEKPHVWRASPKLD